jgi:hypothetical protein
MPAILKRPAQPAFKALSALTEQEKLFRKAEQQSEANKARTEYEARFAAAIANMHRLRALRKTRERVS